MLEVFSDIDFREVFLSLTVSAPCSQHHYMYVVLEGLPRIAFDDLTDRLPSLPFFIKKTASYSTCFNRYFTMPDKCSVTGCKSGYKSQVNSSSGVSFHKFPDDPTLLAAWIDKIPREFHQTLPKQARVCSKHFCELDYVTESFDSNATRRKQRQSVKKKLKPTAIPHVFEGCPRYLTSHCSFASKRTTPMEREKKMEIREEARFADFLEEDRVRTLTDIMNKLDRSMVTGFIHQCVENILSFHCISTTNQDSSPELKCSLLISSDLSFSAFSNG